MKSVYSTSTMQSIPRHFQYISLETLLPRPLLPHRQLCSRSSTMPSWLDLTSHNAQPSKLRRWGALRLARCRRRVIAWSSKRRSPTLLCVRTLRLPRRTTHARRTRRPTKARTRASCSAQALRSKALRLRLRLRLARLELPALLQPSKLATPRVFVHARAFDAQHQRADLAGVCVGGVVAPERIPGFGQARDDRVGGAVGRPWVAHVCVLSQAGCGFGDGRVVLEGVAGLRTAWECWLRACGEGRAGAHGRRRWLSERGSRSGS